MFLKIGDRRINIDNISYYKPYFDDRVQIHFKEKVDGDYHTIIMCGSKEMQQSILKRLDDLTNVETLDHFPETNITLE